MDCSLPVSSVHGILQARILEWVSMSFSRGSSQPRDRTQLSALGGGLSTIWATREALAVLEFPASLSWETHTGFLPVRPVILGFSCTEWVNTYLENRIPRSVCLRWSVLRWAETYLQCHPWLLGHYCELEEGRAGLGVGGAAQEDGRCHPPHLPSRGVWQGRVGHQVPVWGVCLFTFLPVLCTVSFTFQTGGESTGGLFLLILLSEGRACGGWDLEEELLR